MRPQLRQAADDAAVAKWLQSLGGQVQMADGKITSISLARVDVHRCPGQIPGFAFGPRETGSRSHGRERPRTGIAGQGSPALRDLNLSFTAVSDRGLAQLEPLTMMRRLSLAGIRATGPGFVHLEKMAGLKELDLTSTVDHRRSHDAYRQADGPGTAVAGQLRYHR